MLAVNYTTVRNNLKDIFDKVTDDSEAIIITRKDEKNVVMISLDEYNNLMENDFIYSNKKYYSHLLKSREQLEKGRIIAKTAKEIEDMGDE